jgi:hypothetical protein
MYYCWQDYHHLKHLKWNELKSCIQPWHNQVAIKTDNIASIGKVAKGD